MLLSFGFLERLKRARAIEVKHCVELAGKISLEVVANTLGFRSINHPDCSLETRLRQQRRARLGTVQTEKEPGDLRVVKPELVTARQRGTNLLYFARIIPVRRRGHSACVSGEPHQYRLRSVLLPNELSDVELAAPTHFGRARIAEVSVVGP